MNDLLSAVKGSAIYGRPDDSLGEDVEANIGLPLPPGKSDMESFYEKVNDIKKDFLQIKTLHGDVLASYERGKGLIKTKDMQAHREELQEELGKVSRLAAAAKAKLEALERDNEAARKRPGQGVGSASERSRTTITAGLKRKLKELCEGFMEFRNQITAEYQDVVAKRVYAVTGQELSEEEIERIVEQGEGDQIFQKAIHEQGRQRVLDTLAEVQERNRDLRSLVASFMELKQLLLDMAVSVEAQGEHLDNIEKQVERSAAFVQTGVTAVQDAKRLQKNTRKWMLCGIITTFLIIVAIVLAVVLTIRPWETVRRVGL